MKNKSLLVLAFVLFSFIFIADIKPADAATCTRVNQWSLCDATGYSYPTADVTYYTADTCPSIPVTQQSCTNHNGADWTIDNNTEISGGHINVRNFKVVSGRTAKVKYFDGGTGGFLEVHANNIIVDGTIDANGVGFGGGGGGGGGAGGAEYNGRGISGSGGAGVQGGARGSNGTDIPNNSANYNKGDSGGAGGLGAGIFAGSIGSGGSGGDWCVAGNCTLPTNGTNGTIGKYCNGVTSVCDNDLINVTLGSGGSGGGGGGGFGADEGSCSGNGGGGAGGAGGNGGGKVVLFSSNDFTVGINGKILASGVFGGNGANGYNGAGCSSGGNGGTGGSSGLFQTGVKGIGGTEYYPAGGNRAGAGGNGGGGAGGGILIKANSVNISGTVNNLGASSTVSNGGSLKIFSCATSTTPGTLSNGRLLKVIDPSCPSICSVTQLMYQNTTQRIVNDPATSTYEFGKNMVVDKIEIDWNDSDTNCAAYLRLGLDANLNVYQIPKASGSVGPYDVCTNCNETVNVNVPSIISDKLSFGVIDKPGDDDPCGTVKINSVKVYGKVDSCATASCSATNLITNGDFQNGFTGFTTEYSLQAYPGSTSLEPAGTVGLIVDPIQVNKYFISFLDKTFGNYSSGRMLISNGAVDTTGSPARMKDIVCTNITVEPNTDYYLSAWVRTAVSTPSNPARDARPQFFVNGVSITNDNPVTDTAWVNKEGEWNSGSTTTAKFCIRTNSTVLEGNDLAVDDMWFGKGNIDLCSTVTPTLSATCYGAPNPASTSTVVTWWSTVSGGDGSYSYDWTGTDGLTGSASTVSKTYTSTGPKQATVKVTSGAASTTISCFGSTGNTGDCTSNCGITATSTLPVPTCSDGIMNGTETGIDCGGSCPACIVPSNVNCTSLYPSSNLVNVNTNTVWTALFSTTTSALREWRMIDSNNTAPGEVVGNTSSNTLDKIFTTIGQKIITVQIGTGDLCTATTTVVQTGGSGGEI